jgi:hypothetical protein
MSELSLPGLATPDLAASSSLVAPETASSGLDAAAIDRNLRTIRTVQSTWRLPSMPDNVMLDLASMPGAHPEHLSDLLNGLDTDIHQEDEEPARLYSPIQWNDPKTLQEPSGMDQFRTVFNGLLNDMPPTENSVDSVKAWKQQAIDRGYLASPDNGVVDSTWDPSLNSVRYQMFQDDLDRSYRGNRPGAMSMDSVLSTLNKWTSPSGLLGAAQHLDLWWDPKAISHEFSTWGDKFRKLGKSKNPFDFGKNLIDALTGPIDDIIVPAVNIALLATGVGEAYNFARVSIAGAELATEGSTLFKSLYEIPKLGTALSKLQAPFKVADIGVDVEKFGEASTLATRLGRSENTLISGAGDALKSWREFQPVRTSKKFVQTGMKLGLLSQAEDNLLPGYQGGKSIGDIGAVKSFEGRFKNSPFVAPLTMAGEALFTPYTILSHGSLTGSLSEATGAIGRGLGTTGGRAAAGALVGATAGLTGDDSGDVVKGALLGAGAGAALPVAGRVLEAVNENPLGRVAGKAAVGAAVGGVLGAATGHDVSSSALLGAGVGAGSGIAKAIADSSAGRVGGSRMVGHVSDFLQSTSFKPMADDQKIAAVFHNSYVQHLAQSGQTDVLDTYTSAFDQGGFKHAMKMVHGMDDEELGAGPRVGVW